MVSCRDIDRNERMPEMCQIFSVLKKASRHRGCHTLGTEPMNAVGCQNSGLHISFSKGSPLVTRYPQGPVTTQYRCRLTDLLVSSIS